MSLVKHQLGSAGHRALRDMGLELTQIEPFGLLARSPSPGRDIRSLPEATLRDLTIEHGLLVLRGFSPLSREELPPYCATWGPLYNWEFGAILDLIVHDPPTNYLFDNGNVPFHWDGAFRESLPSFQFFQCLQAPPRDTGGETQFCDTTRVLDEAPADLRALWESLTISYTTNKVAHYGGQIHVPMVSTHPGTGRPTLRVGLPNDAETSPLNPVHIQVEGMTPDQSDRFFEELREILYAPRYTYAHAWEDGDLAAADNHALIHGRRAFRTHSQRHLQRVHIC
jgi:alpha-ketoglutarate-dependent taurine dioxygenase